MTIDAETLRRNHRISDIASRYGVALRQDGREWWSLCPFHGEDSPSFHVFTGKDGVQRCHCFGCGEGGDVIQFVMSITGLAFPAACAELEGGKPSIPLPANPSSGAPDPYADYVTMLPAPRAALIEAGKKTPEILNPKRSRSVVYTPTAVYPYRGRDGRLIAYVLRCETDRGKFTPTVQWMKNSVTGWAGWSHGSLPAPRPLYGLPELFARPNAQVLLVEGEKCKDAAAVALPELVSCSWCGGGKAWARTNFEPLRGRSVVLWPDADDEGRVTMDSIAGKLTADYGCKVKMVKVGR